MPSAPRILIARLFHESHAFSPLVTGSEAFETLRGTALLAAARGSGTTLGGLIASLEAARAELLPVVSATAPPGGLVEHGFYRDIRDELAAAARQLAPDAVALELHGAMATTVLPDAEGDLLAHLRAAVGERVPVGVGLDLHAHITPAMLRAADLVVACKENPHSDVVACGEKVAEGLLAILCGALSPVTTMWKTRMILPGAQETTGGPLQALHEEARRLAASDPAIFDVSLYNVYRSADAEEMGQAAVVVSNGPSERAGQIARELAVGFWSRREAFVDDLDSISEALDRVGDARGRERFVLADMGDRVLAGAPGDSTAILAAALERRDGIAGAIPVTDAEAVAAARAAGVGGRLCLALGGRLTPGFRPLSVEATVVALGDGAFAMRGPYRAGERTELGPSATLLVDGRLSVLATTRPGFTHDPNAFESQGIAIARQDFVVVKSGYHFRLNFEGLATPLMVRTPGIGSYTPGLFAWRRGRFWPEHEVAAAPLIGPLVVDRQRIAA